MGRIQLKSVTNCFGDVEVFPPLDLTIKDGEFIVFVGLSGCGKSTLLRLIAGLEGITTGAMTLTEQMRPMRHPQNAWLGDRVPALRAVPIHDRAQENRLSPAHGQAISGRDR